MVQNQPLDTKFSKTERRDVSVETAWHAMLDLESRFALNFLWDLTTVEELQRMKNGKGEQPGMYQLIADSYTLDSMIKQAMSDSVDRVRPFLGEVLYDIVAIHLVVVIRAAADLHDVACKQSNKHWSTDKLVHNALDGVGFDLDNSPKIGEVLTHLKRLFCLIYAGQGAHTPTDTPKSIGFRPGMPSAAG